MDVGLGGGGGHLRGQIGGAVVEAGVQAQRFYGMGAFFGPARHTDHAQSPGFRQLAHGAAHGAGGGRDDDGFTGSCVCDVVQADPGGEAGHAENAQSGLGRGERGIDGAQFVDVGNGVITPAEGADDGVARFETGTVGSQDFAHRLTSITPPRGTGAA